MSETTKTAENVIPRRRATDWQQPLNVPNPDPFGWREGDEVAFMDDRAVARVSAALNGARTLVAVLMQHDMDRHDEDGNGLALGERTTYGLFEALASCLELADMHATGGKPSWTTRMRADDPEADQLRQAAHGARRASEDRRAAERVAYLNRAKAAKKGAA